MRSSRGAGADRVSAASDARRLLEAAGAAGATIGVAEWLTGGMLADALVSVPGASAVFRGGIVAYATDLKAALLGVDADLLAAVGAVDPAVAAQMADGVARVTGARLGLATTGVAGPTPQDGHDAGTVCIAASLAGATTARTLHLDGDRAQVRAATVAAALRLGLEVLRGAPRLG